MTLVANVVANFVGQGVTALLALACIPFYVSALGVEAYGLIGFYSTLYATLGVVDGSVQAMLARSAAQHRAQGNLQDLLDRLRTLEWLYAAAVVLLVVAMAAGSFFLVGHWLKADTLDRNIMRETLVWMALALGTRCYEGLYRGVLLGLERQVTFNALHSAGQVLRWVGAVAIVTWIEPDTKAFFQWQALAGIGSALALGGAAHRAAGGVGLAKWRPRLLWGERRFLGGMLAITGAAVLLTQTDKLLLSHLLPLREYAGYMLAATASGVIMLLVPPIADAFYPRLVRHHAANDTSGMAHDFHLGAQMVSVIAGSAAATGIVFAPWLLRWWLGDEALVRQVTPIFRILLLGNLLNALMWMPYRAQLAHGWTGLAARINAVAVIVLIPMVILFALICGGEGAAWTWVALNVGYVFVVAQLMFRRILMEHATNWYIRDICVPLFCIAFSAIIGLAVLNVVTYPLNQVAVLLSAGIANLIIGIMVAPELRAQIFNLCEWFRRGTHV
jgi:O-antigen/teichoic acid export membrane protein